jgi:hypothetical protein
MGPHVVRRGAAGISARRPEALPTSKLSEEEVRGLLRDYAQAALEPADLEPGVEVIHGEPEPGAEPSASAAAAPRLAHTLRRDPVALAASPDAAAAALAPAASPTSPAGDRADIATIAMPRFKRPLDCLIALPARDDFESVVTALPVPSATPESVPRMPTPRRLAAGMPPLVGRPRLEAALPTPKLRATDAIEPLAFGSDAAVKLVPHPVDLAPEPPAEARRQPAIPATPAIVAWPPSAAEPRRPVAPGVPRWYLVLSIAVLLILLAVLPGLARVISDAPLTLR